MILAIGIIYVLYVLIKAAIDDVEMRDYARSQGWGSYPSQTGMRDVKTNMHCYTNPTTGKKTMWK